MTRITCTTMRETNILKYNGIQCIEFGLGQKIYFSMEKIIIPDFFYLYNWY